MILQAKPEPVEVDLNTSAVVVVDIKTRKLVQKLPTSVEARSLDVSLANNRVYLATTADKGPCGGCIQAFAPE